MAGITQGGDASESLPELPVDEDGKECPEADYNEERIEYDDAAILDFHPHLRRRLTYKAEFNKAQEAEKEITAVVNDDVDHDEVVKPKQPIHTAQSPEEMAKKILKVPLEKLAKLKEDIKTCRKDMTGIKTEFEKMNKSLNKLESCHRIVKKRTKSVLDELDVVIHQNTIIKHLVQVAEEIELFQCYVTEDRHVMFVDYDEVLVQECSAHDERGNNNSCCTCQYKRKIEVYDDVD